MQLKRCPRPPGERGRCPGYAVDMHALQSMHHACQCVCTSAYTSAVYIDIQRRERTLFLLFASFFTSFCLTMPWHAYLHAYMYHIHSSPFNRLSSIGHPMTTAIACLSPHGSMMNNVKKKRRDTSFPQALARLTLQHRFTP